MKRRITALFLALALLCAILPTALFSASAASSGTCGENLTWSYNEATKTLTISGSGEMEDFDWMVGRPWESFVESIETINLPDSLTSIGDWAFLRCNSLTSVTIPDSVTSIGNYAFEDCSSLTSVTIPDSVTSIGNEAFRICSSLMGITVAEENPNYSSDAYGVLFNKNKTELICCPGGYSGSYTIPDSVTSIGYGAFCECSSLTSVTIGNSVTSIGGGAFYGCSSLTSVTIPDSVTSIGEDAFYGCSSLTSITIPDSVTSIGAYAFGVCSSLTSVTIPDSVTSIGGSTFSDCSSLTSVTIPDSVTSIGNYAFEGCSSLTSVTVAEENPNYSSDAYGVLFNKNKTELICCPGGYSGSYTIPDSVTSIGDGAFMGCSSLTSVTIGNSVTSIGEDAFSCCSSLTSVTIGNSVTSIGYGAFYGCSSLTSVTIGNSVTSIGNYAFYGCSSLTSVYFCGDAPELYGYVFETWDKLKEGYIVIPGLTLYYIEGKTGWTTPTWNGYPTAIWKPESEDKPTTTFTDVKTSDWFYKAVNFAVSNSLFNGMGDNKFEPDTAMNRAMLVTVLWRYAGSPKEGTNTFTDVKTGQWYTDAVAWASSNSIVGGVGGGKFDPNGNVTREQLAAILFRYCDYKEIGTDKRGDLSTFPDKAKVSSWATAAYSWAVGEGLIGGNQINGQTLLDPQGNATRAQVATILMRFIQNIAEK